MPSGLGVHRQQSDRLLLMALTITGFAGLGYEIVWTRLLVLAVGAEHPAVLGVLAGFFLGLSLGALLFHTRVRKARNPARYYVVLELIAAAYAVTTPFLFAHFAASMPRLLSPLMVDAHAMVALSLSVLLAGLLLLPATLCLGATLPALVELRRRLRAPQGDHQRGMGRLYGANTLGAMLGTVGTIYMLLPHLGMVGAMLLHATLAIAAAAMIGWRYTPTQVPPPETAERQDGRLPHAAQLGWLFCTGLAGVAYEVIGVRILSQVLSGSIYTFSNILFIYLLGTAVGAWLYSLIVVRKGAHQTITLATLLFALTTATLVSAFTFAHATQIHDAMAGPAVSFVRGITAEIGVAALAFGLPSLLMGAVFTHLTAPFTASGVGRAVAINTLGSAVAPLLFGLWIIDWLGYSPAFYLVPLLYGVLFLLAATTTSAKRWHPWAAGLLLVALALTTPRSMAQFPLLPGHRVVTRDEGAMGHVVVQEAIEETFSGHPPTRELVVDRLHRMGGGSGYSQRRWGHMALLLSPRRGSALFLGLGTAGSMAAALAYDFDSIDGVELMPGILAALPSFAYLNDSIAEHPRVNLHCADARRFVAASNHTYDAIVADLYHPDAAGVSMLYSVTHYQRMRSLLTPKGVCVQMVPIFQLSDNVLKTIVRTFLAVFPHTYAFMGHHALEAPLLLVGLNGKPQQHAPAIQDLNGAITGNPAIQAYVQGADDFLGSYVCGSEELRVLAGDGPLNTDLNPQIMFEGPYFAYDRSNSPSRSNLLTIKSHKTPPDPKLVRVTETPADKGLWNSAKAQSRAIEYLHRGEMLAAGYHPADLPQPAVAAYLEAYAMHPGFMLNLGIMHRLEPMLSRYPKLILGSMLRVTPHIPELQEAYEHYVKKSDKMVQ